MIVRRVVATVSGLVLASAAVATTPCRSGAQRPAGTQVEGRVDAIAATTPSLQLGAGFNVPAGLYVRLGTSVAAGVAHRNGVTHAAGRGEAVARFLLDPYAEYPLALYGVAGISIMHDPFEHTRPRVLVGVGIESRVRDRRAVAAEVALGGGVRVGLAIRRGRRTGR